jgi:hypothetical protein
MKLELYLQNSNDGTVYDISNIAEEIQVSQQLDGDAGKLTCILQKDPNNLLKIANGSIVSFIVDGTGFFFGYVFKIGTDADENYKITCYDQMRYLKNSDVMTTSNMTASNIFAKICDNYGLRYSINVPSYYVPEAYVHDNKTLYTIIKRGMDLACINENAQYFIVDRFGTLVWSEFSYEKTNIQLGGGSMLTSYTYEKSIDDDTYNQIKLYRDNDTTGKRDTWIVKDSDNIKKWGILQYLKKADDDVNASQIRQTAENYLKVKNSETETLKLEAEGIKELTVGKGIKFVLPRENIDKWMWITSSTHTFTKYTHTMDLEVEI